MAGIYLHIPFCRQACHYCNFHFATSLRHKNELLAALLKEATLQRDFFAGEPVETVYFGGGTPSLLEAAEITRLLDEIRSLYHPAAAAEVTLEANPDDLSEEKLMAWKAGGINRLSIGVQSFFEEDLRWMNRAHTALQAEQGLEKALQYFDNITIDLIYGTPGLTDERWQQNMEKAIRSGVPHLSCYALTVEPNTPLRKMIGSGKKQDVDPDSQSNQFLQLMDRANEAGYEHYEISNFARPGYRSRHNSSYWQGKRYLGLGPSAHSFDGSSRQWNVANNQAYIRSLQEGGVPFEKEMLSNVQRENEYIMISLRTIEGLDPERLSPAGRVNTRAMLEKYLAVGKVEEYEGKYRLTREGKLLADGIAADLFTV